MPTPPIILSVTPNKGPKNPPPPHPLVTITGDHFQEGMGVTVSEVKFGTGDGIGLSVQSNTSVTVTPPSNPLGGTVDVRVRTLAGQSPISDQAKYTYVGSGPPQI